MKQKNQSEVQQALGDKKMLERVAKSQDAKALAGMLSQGHSQADLKKIAESAAKGDTAQLSQLIRSITSSPDGAELLRRLGNSFGS